MALLETTTAEGAELGMNVAEAPHKLPDHQVAYLQDCLVNQAGLISRRGAIQGALAIGANLNGKRPVGVCSCFDPQGTFRIMVLYWDVSLVSGGSVQALWGAVFDSSFTFISRNQLTPDMKSGSGAANYPTLTQPGLVVQASQAIDGAVLITASAGYNKTDPTATVKWYGAAAPNSSIASGAFVTLTPVTTVGSFSFTGSTADIAKLAPGMVVQNLGVIKSIDSTTQFTLINAAINTVGGAHTYLYGVTGAYSVFAGRGKISTSITSTTITGYGTKFLSTVVPANNFGQWWLINPADGSIIAYAAAAVAIPSDTQLTGANVLQQVSMADYLLVTVSGGTPVFVGIGLSSSGPDDVRAFPNTIGRLHTTFKGFQFLFNAALPNSWSGDLQAPATRCYIAGPHRTELMDHATDGNYFDVVSTVQNDLNGIAIYGGRDAVVLCKFKETFAVVGDDPDNFSLTKITDDGALSVNSITGWKGNVIWVGQKGIWLFDGVHAPINLVEKTLGDRWQQFTTGYSNSLTPVDAGGYPVNMCHCFVHRDHLFVNLVNTGSQHSVYTDGVARTQNPMQLAIYLPNNALSFLTNFNFVGYVPGWGTNQNKGYTLLAQDSAASHFLFPIDNLFVQGAATTDTFLTPNSYNSGTPSTSVGPWFHMESRKFFAGDGLLRKTWKQLATESFLTSTKRMFLETVPGLNTTGTRVSTPYIGVSLWKALKLRFNSRDQYMSFRLYEDIANRPATLILGAWQWGYKLARRGQV